MISVRAKSLVDEVNLFLDLCDPSDAKNWLLPNAWTLCVLSYEDEERNGMREKQGLEKGEKARREESKEELLDRQGRTLRVTPPG
jgi:hypothetical protein